ncbi:MAG: hypothetical protein JNL87_02170 [Burkholderiaceae bacterium]|nr:hypothetical protein [Burkholderiaceae bacterium]
MSLVPAQRTGRPDGVAALVAFLCGDDAAPINGAEIDIGGGASRSGQQDRGTAMR